MAEEKSFRFACPHCGQPLAADFDMVGMLLDCPECGQPFQVPELGDKSQGESTSHIVGVPGSQPGLGVEAETTRPVPPMITVVRKRERFIIRLKKRMKAVGIGVAVLLLFVGVGVIKEYLDETETATAMKEKSKVEGGVKVKAVMTSLECLLNYVEMPNKRRLGVLSRSLESCPEDFMDAVKGFLVSVSRTSDDMISDREREDMIKGKIALGLIFGAVNQNDPQSGVAAGLQLGDLISAKAQETANQRLKQDIESKLNHLLDVAERYGVDPNKLETALVSRMR